MDHTFLNMNFNEMALERYLFLLQEDGRAVAIRPDEDPFDVDIVLQPSDEQCVNIAREVRDAFTKPELEELIEYIEGRAYEMSVQLNNQFEKEVGSRTTPSQEYELAGIQFTYTDSLLNLLRDVLKTHNTEAV